MKRMKKLAVAATMAGWLSLAVVSAALLALAQTAPAQVVSATGGNATNDIGGYRIHTFTNSATFNVTAGGAVDVLAVAGGGGGVADI